MRDATSEAQFFQTYGNVFALYLADAEIEAGAAHPAVPADARELPVVKDALASIARGGLPEALTRTAALLAHNNIPFPLERIAVKEELLEEYQGLLPVLPRDAWRRIRGEQDIIVRYEPERALATLPDLLADHADRERLLVLFERLLADERLQAFRPTAGQRAMLTRIRETLGIAPMRRRGAARARKVAVKRPPAAMRKPGAARKPATGR